MINKKLLIIFSAAAALAASTASAKTEGNYIGAHIAKTDADFDFNGLSTFEDRNYGFGAHYKYAFNNNDVFVAPGIFVEKQFIKGGDAGNSAQLNSRYGVGVDLGYDFTSDFAAYLTGGAAFLDTKVEYPVASTHGFNLDWFAGAGLAFNITKEAVLNLEYSRMDAKFDAPYGDKIDADINIIQLGASYRF